MRSSVVLFLAFLTAVVNAHFQLLYPPPRGVFNEANENKFCDGYPTPTSNRTRFPLSGGFVNFDMNLHSDHWVAGILVSTVQLPSEPKDFVLHNGYVSDSKPGTVCLPLDFSKSNVTGLSAGQNITIQLVWSGGDGTLFQCADLSLAPADSVSLPSVKCENQAATPSHSGQAPSTSIAKSIMSLVALAATLSASLLL